MPSRFTSLVFKYGDEEDLKGLIVAWPTLAAGISNSMME